MKLIRWVEVHIGRSRKKAKKTPTKRQGSPGDVLPDTPSHTAASYPRGSSGRPDAGEDSWSCHGRSPGPSPCDPRGDPGPGSQRPPKAAAHIRTSFLDQVPPSPADASSPRQRSRIQTNPWIRSPRSPCGSSSADSGWAGSRSSTGSESSEPGDLALHEAPWYSHWTSLSSLRNHAGGEPAATGPWALTAPGLRPRTSSTLESYRGRQQPRAAREPPPTTLLGGSTASDGFLRRPESARLYRKEAPRKSLITHISDGSSSSSSSSSSGSSSDDEAYSEDFVQSEDSDVVTVVKAVTSPQTDSACDPGSCTTTPLSECCTQLHAPAAETLSDKVRRLRAQRLLVQQKMQEARLEEQLSREQRILLHQELMQFRRLMLLKTLQGLRSDLEHRTASSSPSQLRKSDVPGAPRVDQH
ncbi:unnamed protein product [Ixodes hexagonus]